MGGAVAESYGRPGSCGVPRGRDAERPEAADSRLASSGIFSSGMLLQVPCTCVYLVFDSPVPLWRFCIEQEEVWRVPGRTFPRHAVQRLPSPAVCMSCGAVEAVWLFLGYFSVHHHRPQPFALGTHFNQAVLPSAGWAERISTPKLAPGLHTLWVP